jgi:aminobenzoyl-glutamate utilization protein B
MNLSKWIDAKQKKFTEISDQIWRFAETRYRETQSAELLAETLDAAEFTVERGVAGIPSAFIASYGSGKPVVAILGEYDALPGLSQEAVPHQQPLEAGGNGHGCGHNLLGTGSLAASLAVKEAIKAGNLPGTIRFYGCPAEEGGAAKAFMVKAGLFDDVDLSLTWHPSAFNSSMSVNLLARSAVYFRFHGQTAHAAIDPFNGRSALDAVELMNVGVNYLREHIIPDARIHYVITNGGGRAPNVVPAEAESLYYIRAPKTSQVQEIFERVKAVAQGAALMTGTESELEFHSGTSDLLINDTIADLLYEKMIQVGAPKFDQDEQRFAQELAQTFPKHSPGAFAKLLGADGAKIVAELKDTVLVEQIMPQPKTDVVMPGSTDVADVSWVTPTGQIGATCQAIGTPGHSWQVVAQGGMSIGRKGMLFAGKVLALAAAEFLGNPDLLKQARKEFEERIKETPYLSPIPDGVEPPVDEK